MREKKNRYHKLSSHFTGQFFSTGWKFERILQYFRSVHTQLRRPRSLNFERHTYNTLEVSTGRQFVRGGMGGGGGGGGVWTWLMCSRSRQKNWLTYVLCHDHLYFPEGSLYWIWEYDRGNNFRVILQHTKKWNLISRNQWNLLLNIFPSIKLLRTSISLQTRKSYELDILAEYRPLRSTKCFLRF